MPKDPQLRAAQTAAVDQAGVIESIAKDDIFFLDQRRDCSDVGRVAGREQHRGLLPLEACQRLLQPNVRRRSAGHESARASTHSKLGDGGSCGFGDSRIAGQAEIVVARKVPQPPPVDRTRSAGQRLNFATSTTQTGRLQRGDFLGHPRKQCWHDEADAKWTHGKN